MFQNIPERTSYGSSCIFLLIGIFFSIYPIVGIFKNDVILIVRPGGKAHHLHGLDALFIGIGVTLLGLSCLLAAIRNILEERQRRRNLYQIKNYAILNSAIQISRRLSFLIILMWLSYSILLSLA
jgi:hypothetical protein